MPGQDSAKRWFIAFLLTAVFCALQVNQSLMMGSLALPPTFDAVAYFVNGATLLKIFHVDGFGPVLSAFFSQPPHSPFSTGLALLGFSVFGIAPWAATAATAFILFFFVRAFLELARPLPLGQATLLAIALLGFPFVGHTLMDFRPDMICSLLIAAGTLFIVLRESWIYSRQDQVIAGVIFAAALWTKPTIFPFTIVLFGAAMTVAAAAAAYSGKLRSSLVAALVTAGTALLIAFPYYLIRLPETVNYISTWAIGSAWVRPMTLRQHLLYYLTDSYGWQSLGSWLYLGLIIGAAALLAIWRTGNRSLLLRAVLAAIMVVIAYVLVTVPAFKGPPGFPFAGLFLGATALASVTLAKLLGRTLGWVFCIGLLIVSIWQFTWPFQAAYRGHVISADYAASRRDMLRQAMQAMGDDVGGKKILQSTAQQYLNQTVLAFEYLAKGYDPPTGEFAQIVDEATQRRRIAKADFVLSPTPDAGDVTSPNPTAAPSFRAEIIRLTEDSGLFAPPIRISDPIRGGAVLIFKRLSAKP